MRHRCHTPHSPNQTGVRIQRRGAESAEISAEKAKNAINGCWAPASLVGRSPWTAADALVGLFAPCWMLTTSCQQRDAGVPRGPGGPPHQCGGLGAYTA